MLQKIFFTQYFFFISSLKELNRKFFHILSHVSDMFFIIIVAMKWKIFPFFLYLKFFFLFLWEKFLFHRLRIFIWFIVALRYFRTLFLNKFFIWWWNGRIYGFMEVIFFCWWEIAWIQLNILWNFFDENFFRKFFDWNIKSLSFFTEILNLWATDCVFRFFRS